MPLGMEVGLSQGDIVSDGAQLPQKTGARPKFSTHIHCSQTAGWIKIHLVWR